MEGIVNKIIPFSSVDGPGNRTAVFLQGCNFNCVYCHNPETIRLCTGCGECVPHCPTGALSMGQGRVVYDYDKCVFCDGCLTHCAHNASARVRRMSAAAVMEQVKNNMPFIRGITVSGGECTCQRDFLLQLLMLAKGEGLSTLLDSNGSFDFAADSALFAVTDGVMLDVKAWDAAEHLRVTGCGNEQVLENLAYLSQNAKLEEVRTVIAPELFDAEDTVRQVCRVIAPHLAKRDIRYKIICYRPMGVRQEHRSIRPPTPGQLAHLEQIAHAEGVVNTVII